MLFNNVGVFHLSLFILGSGKELLPSYACKYQTLLTEHRNDLSWTVDHCRPISQITQYTSPISHNAPFLQQKCARVCTFLLQNGALWGICLRKDYFLWEGTIFREKGLFFSWIEVFKLHPRGTYVHMILLWDIFLALAFNWPLFN